MTITPNADRTITPSSAMCCSGFEWPCKNPYATLAYWLDASNVLSAEGEGVTVSQFTYAQFYGDSTLTLQQLAAVGNATGLLIGGGTAGIGYAIRITALLNNGERYAWDIYLPVSESIVYETEDGIVTADGSGLVFAGYTVGVN
jgi:hypothetical protein